MSLVLSRYFYFPIAEALKRTPVSRRLRELEASQWWDERQIEAAARRSVAETIEWARREVPFYREKLSKLGALEPRIALEALEAVPVLTKEEIFHRRDDLRAAGLRERVLCGHTSGSGGEALEFYFTRGSLARTEAAQWRGRGWWGIARGDPMLALWGRTISDPRARKRTARRERSRQARTASSIRTAPRPVVERTVSACSKLAPTCVNAARW